MGHMKPDTQSESPFLDFVFRTANTNPDLLPRWIEVLHRKTIPQAIAEGQGPIGSQARERPLFRDAMRWFTSEWGWPLDAEARTRAGLIQTFQLMHHSNLRGWYQWLCYSGRPEPPFHVHVNLSPIGVILTIHTPMPRFDEVEPHPQRRQPIWVARGLGEGSTAWDDPTEILIPSPLGVVQLVRLRKPARPGSVGDPSRDEDIS